MKEVTPLKNVKEALGTLDNGGRFYNLFTDAKDGEIEKAELAKVAGVFTSTQSMFVYLEIAMMNLEQSEEQQIVRALSPGLRSEFQKNRPPHYSPAQAVQQGRAASPAIVRGVPRFRKSNSDFNGFVMIPITTGQTTSFMMIPIVDQYDVYEVRDEETEEVFLIAHVRGAQKLPEVMMTFGGTLKELQGKNGKKPRHRLFLEALYFSA